MGIKAFYLFLAFLFALNFNSVSAQTADVTPKIHVHALRWNGEEWLIGGEVLPEGPSFLVAYNGKEFSEITPGGLLEKRRTEPESKVIEECNGGYCLLWNEATGKLFRHEQGSYTDLTANTGIQYPYEKVTIMVWNGEYWLIGFGGTGGGGLVRYSGESFSTVELPNPTAPVDVEWNGNYWLIGTVANPRYSGSLVKYDGDETVDMTPKLLQAIGQDRIFVLLALQAQSVAAQPIQGHGKSLVQTSDGGYAIAGKSYLEGNKAWLVKTDSLGKEEWNRTYGLGRANSLVQTSDGGYAIAGERPFYGADVFWLVKTDSLGKEEWSRNYTLGRANSLVQTSDGGYAIAGESYLEGNKAWLVKTDSQGNEEWSRAYALAGAKSLVQTSDGGYALAGKGYPEGVGFGLVKTDSQGNEEWNRTYGSKERYQEPNSLVQTSDGGYAIAGGIGDYVRGLPRLFDFWLLKTDSLGNEEWNRTYAYSYDNFAYSLVQTSDGGYALAGSAFIKTDSQGNEEWNRTYGSKECQEANSLVQTSDGGYAISGTYDSQPIELNEGEGYCLVKTDSQGNEEWNRIYSREKQAIVNGDRISREEASGRGLPAKWVGAALFIIAALIAALLARRKL